jgi:hypothetical protein
VADAHLDIPLHLAGYLIGRADQPSLGHLSGQHIA